MDYNYNIRPDIKETLDRYASQGIPTGDFLAAVLSNNLMEAMGRADSFNQATLPEICSYIYNELPSPCHGSPEKVNAWLELKRQEREAAA
jgi:predicted nucleotidyltransferase